LVANKIFTQKDIARDMEGFLGEIYVKVVNITILNFVSEHCSLGAENTVLIDNELYSESRNENLGQILIKSLLKAPPSQKTNYSI
jgi:hypothetical protein